MYHPCNPAFLHRQSARSVPIRSTLPWRIQFTARSYAWHRLGDEQLFSPRSDIYIICNKIRIDNRVNSNNIFLRLEARLNCFSHLFFFVNHRFWLNILWRNSLAKFIAVAKFMGLPGIHGVLAY
jgi:hypothetical protein